MAIRKILTEPDPFLRQKSTNVEDVNDEIRLLMNDMVEMQWQNLRRSNPADFDKSPDTSIKQEVVNKVGKSLINIPEGFKPIKQIEKQLKQRDDMF